MRKYETIDPTKYHSAADVFDALTAEQQRRLGVAMTEYMIWLSGHEKWDAVPDWAGHHAAVGRYYGIRPNEAWQDVLGY